MRGAISRLTRPPGPIVSNSTCDSGRRRALCPKTGAKQQQIHEFPRRPREVCA